MTSVQPRMAKCSSRPPGALGLHIVLLSGRWRAKGPVEVLACNEVEYVILNDITDCRFVPATCGFLNLFLQTRRIAGVLCKVRFLSQKQKKIEKFLPADSSFLSLYTSAHFQVTLFFSLHTYSWCIFLFGNIISEITFYVRGKRLPLHLDCQNKKMCVSKRPFFPYKIQKKTFK